MMDIDVQKPAKKPRKSRKKSSTTKGEENSIANEVRNTEFSQNGTYSIQQDNSRNPNVGNGAMDGSNALQFGAVANGPAQYNPTSEGYPANSHYASPYNAKRGTQPPSHQNRYPGAPGQSMTLSQLLTTPNRYPQPQNYPAQSGNPPPSSEYGHSGTNAVPGQWDNNQMRQPQQQYALSEGQQNPGIKTNIGMYGHPQYSNQSHYNNTSRGYPTMQNLNYSQPSNINPGYPPAAQYGQTPGHPYPHGNHMMGPPRHSGQSQQQMYYQSQQHSRGQYPGQTNINQSYAMGPSGGHFPNTNGPSNHQQRMETPMNSQETPGMTLQASKNVDMGSSSSLQQQNVSMHMKSPGRGTPQPPLTPASATSQRSAAPSPMSATAAASPLVHPNPTVAHLRTPSAPGSPTMQHPPRNPMSPAPVRPGTPGPMQMQGYHRHSGALQHNGSFSNSSSHQSLQSPPMGACASPAPSQGSMMSPPHPGYSQSHYQNQSSNRPTGGSTPGKMGSQPPTPGTPQSVSSQPTGPEFQNTQRRTSWQGQQQNQVLSPHLSTHGSDIGDPSTPTSTQYGQQQGGQLLPAQQPTYGQDGQQHPGGRSGAAAAAALAMAAAEHSARTGTAQALPNPAAPKEVPQQNSTRLPYHPNYSNIQSSGGTQSGVPPHEGYPTHQQQGYPQYQQPAHPQNNAMMPNSVAQMPNTNMTRPMQPHHPPPQPSYPGYPPHGNEHMQYPPHPGMGHPGYPGPGQHHMGTPPTYDDRPKSAQHMGPNIMLQKTPKFPESKKSSSARSASQKLTALYEPEEPGRKEFIDGVLRYWEDKQCPLKHAPLMGRKTLDLFRLYHLVKERGFMQEVTKMKVWPDICRVMGLGTTSTSGFTLKKQYCKYLYGFECRYERGEMEPPEALGRVTEANRKKKQAADQQANTECVPPPQPNQNMMQPHGTIPPQAPQQHHPYREMAPQPYPGQPLQRPPMTPENFRGGMTTGQRYQHPPHQMQQYPGSNSFRQPNPMAPYPHNSQSRYPSPQQPFPQPMQSMGPYSGKEGMPAPNQYNNIPAEAAIKPPSRPTSVTSSESAVVPPSQSPKQRVDNKLETSQIPPVNSEKLQPVSSGSTQENIPLNSERGKTVTDAETAKTNKDVTEQNSEKKADEIVAPTITDIPIPVLTSSSIDTTVANAVTSNSSTPAPDNIGVADSLPKPATDVKNKAMYSLNQPTPVPANAKHKRSSLQPSNTYPQPGMQQTALARPAYPGQNPNQVYPGTGDPYGRPPYYGGGMPQRQRTPMHGQYPYQNSGNPPTMGQGGPMPSYPGHRPSGPGHADPSNRPPWNQTSPSGYNRPPYGHAYPQQPNAYGTTPNTTQFSTSMKRPSNEMYHGPPNKINRLDEGAHAGYYPRPQGGHYQAQRMDDPYSGQMPTQRDMPMTSNTPYQYSGYPGNKQPYDNHQTLMSSPGNYNRPMTPNSRWDPRNFASQQLQGIKKGQMGRMSPLVKHGTPTHRPSPGYNGSPRHIQKMNRYIRHDVKRMSVFPAGAIESTQPRLIKRKKKYCKDVGVIEAWQIIMSLKSGLLAESTWALNSLTILLHDEQTLNQVSLPQLPGLLDAIVDHFKCCLKELFRLPGEMLLCTKELSVVDGDDVIDQSNEMKQFKKIVTETMKNIESKKVLNGLKTLYCKLPLKVVTRNLPHIFDKGYKWDKEWKGESNHELDHIVPVFSSKSKHLQKLADKKQCNDDKTLSSYSVEEDMHSELTAVEAVLEDILTFTGSVDLDDKATDLICNEKPPPIKLANLSKKKEDKTDVKNELKDDEETNNIKETNKVVDDKKENVDEMKAEEQMENEKDKKPEDLNPKEEDMEVEKSFKDDESKDSAKSEEHMANDLAEMLSKRDKNLHIKSCIGKLRPSCNVVLVDDETMGCPGRGSTFFSKYEYHHQANSYAALNSVFCDGRDVELQYRVLCLSNIIRSLSCISTNVQELWKHRTLMQILAEMLLFRHKHKKRCLAKDIFQNAVKIEKAPEDSIATANMEEVEATIESSEQEKTMDTEEKQSLPKIPTIHQNGISPTHEKNECCDKDAKENNDPTTEDVKHLMPNNIKLNRSKIKDIKEAIKQQNAVMTNGPTKINDEEIINLTKAIVKQKNINTLNSVSVKHITENSIKVRSNKRLHLFAPKVEEEQEEQPVDTDFNPIFGKCVFTEESNPEVQREYKDAWWWDCVHTIRENSLVAITNLSPFIDITQIPDDDVALTIIDSCLHWAVCPSSEAKDGFNTLHSRSSLSPQRLVMEALTKFSVKEQNVDLILATKPFSRIEKLISILISFISNRHDRVMREFAVVLLSNLACGDAVVSRAIALQKGAVSTLLMFLEDCEETGITNRRMLPGQQGNCGTSSYIMLRCAVTIYTLSKLPENRSLFLKLQVRLLSLSMSTILGREVLRKLAVTLFELRLL